MLGKIYEFNEFRVDLAQKTLCRNGELVAIQPKVFDVLVAFVRRSNMLLTREELMQEVWGDTFVEESNLRFCIHTLRKILAGNYIETVPKRGYRFQADVREIESEPSAPAPVAHPLSLENALPVAVKPVRVGLFFLLPTLFLIALIFFAFTAGKRQTSAAKMTIAVLPFTQIAPHPSPNLNVTDAIIIQLTKLRDFQVLPISAVQQYATQDVPALTVGKALQSDAVLHGSFRHDNANASVTANLQNVATGESLWSETFEIKLDQGVNLESAIAARLARLLSLKVVEYDDEKLAKTQTVNPEALSAYLTARRIWRSRDLGRVKETTALLQKALTLEPNWVLAQTAQSEALLTEDYTLTVFEAAEKAAQQALVLDAQQAGALSVLGRIKRDRDWDFAEAENYLKKATEITPENAAAYHEYGVLLAAQGKFSESEKMLQKALKQEPFSPYYNTSLCSTYYYDQKTDLALKQCKYALQLEPQFWLARKRLFWIYVHKKMHKEVSEMILSGYSESARAQLPYLKSLQEHNLTAYWRHTLAANKGFENPSVDAMFYLQLNDKENALDNLERAFAQRDSSFPAIRVEPIFEPLWGEQRFIALLQKLTLKP